MYPFMQTDSRLSAYMSLHGHTDIPEPSRDRNYDTLALLMRKANYTHFFVHDVHTHIGFVLKLPKEIWFLQQTTAGPSFLWVALMLAKPVRSLYIIQRGYCPFLIYVYTHYSIGYVSQTQSTSVTLTYMASDCTPAVGEHVTPPLYEALERRILQGRHLQLCTV